MPTDLAECMPAPPDSRPRGALTLESDITCPLCGAVKAEVMPTDACQFFYDCTGCGAVLRPKPGDCCVFCSYGTTPCPPVQLEGRSPGSRDAAGGAGNSSEGG